MSFIKVAICEDAPLTRELIADYVKNEPVIHVVGSVGTKTELLELLSTAEVDILLLDINLDSADGANRSGIEASIEIKTLFPDLKIIVISCLDDEQTMMHAMTYGGAVNYIVKGHYLDLPQAIKDTYENKPTIHYSSAPQLIRTLTAAAEKELIARITDKQREILLLFDRGLRRKEIAEKLFTSEQVISNEIFKLSKALKGKLPYLEMLRLKKVDVKELIEISRRLKIIP